jgi:hypothetical protein
LKVQLKDVHHLMAERMTKLRKVSPERQRYAPLEEISGPQQPLRGGERKDIGLLEIGVRCVDNQRDPGSDVVAKLNGQGIVTRLGIREGGWGQLGFRGIVVEVYMGAADNPPIQLPILDLVLAEGEELSVQGYGKDAEDREDGEDGKPSRPYATPLS